MIFPCALNFQEFFQKERNSVVRIAAGLAAEECLITITNDLELVITTLEDFKSCAKEDWEKYDGLDRITVYSHLHPFQAIIRIKREDGSNI